ncbi:MAG: hypothetical protein CM15mP16_12610 [Candidatus Pelagibacterales bacterium]|nr:MAG: hypothetical protein CM15mP16_12610 [Pelagibacterales bacterium]
MYLVTEWEQQKLGLLVAHLKLVKQQLLVTHDIKGQGIYAYVTLNAGEETSDELYKELVAWGSKKLAQTLTDLIQWAQGFQKLIRKNYEKGNFKKDLKRLRILEILHIRQNAG